jgi:hypothetical protein
MAVLLERLRSPARGFSGLIAAANAKEERSVGRGRRRELIIADAAKKCQQGGFVPRSMRYDAP